MILLRKGIPNEVLAEVKALLNIAELKGEKADRLVTIHNEYINKPVQRSDCEKCVAKARINIQDFLNQIK